MMLDDVYGSDRDRFPLEQELDDVYGSDQDQFPLEQESELWAEECPTLEWDEIEIVLDETGIRTLTWDLSGPKRLAE